MAAAGALTTLATAGNDLLPRLLDGSTYASSFNVARHGQWIVTAAAAALVWRRKPHSTLDLWLLVVLCAWFCEIGLAAIFNSGRYDLGFYAGRLFALLASLYILGVLLWEQARLYLKLQTALEIERSEAVLRADREILRLSMEGGRMGAWSVTLPEGRVWLSRELQAILGLPGESYSPTVRAALRPFHPEDVPRLLRTARRATKRSGPFAVEVRFQHAGGQWRWMDVRGQASTELAGQQTLHGIGVDISLRKQTEEDARQVEMKFQALADGIPQLAWMARPDGWIYWYNRGWYDYTGKTAADMEGWGWQSVHDPAVLPAVIERWQHSINTGQTFEMVFPLKGSNGRFRSFLTRVSPLRGEDGKVVHWFGTNTDITAQHDAEAALRASDRRKDEFLATLGHELRNPLAPIRNAIEILKRLPALPIAAQNAHTILDRQSQHMARMVNDLLEISRVSQGKVQLQRSRMNVAQALTDAIQAARPLIDKFHHELIVVMPAEALEIHADSTRITQILVNLLNNAAKFTPENGKIQVTVDREGDQACIRIQDSGIGIDHQYLHGIFEIFSQVAPALNRSQSGLGIGLALARGFVQLHGGDIVASSDGAGKGSMFRVRLPLLPSDQHRPADGPPAQTRTDALRILVVDDNVDAASTLSALLQIEGHELREAYSGPRSIEVADEFRPDVILLDIGMPEMNGYQVARRLRAKKNCSPSPVLVAVTGWGQLDDKNRAYEAGFDFHLTKPLQLEELRKLLCRVGAENGVESSRKQRCP